MATRRVIYIKNPSQGSNFRTIGGGMGITTGGGTVRRRRGLQLPTLPSVSITVNPQYAQAANFWGNFIAGQTLGAVQFQAPGGIASPDDYIAAAQRTRAGIQRTQWVDFLFEDTIFDKDFWAFADISGFTGHTAEDNYYAVAQRAGVENIPPPVYGQGIFGYTDAFDSIRSEIWDATHKARYWDLDPSND